MHGTVPQKLGRLVANLALHPQYIPRCLAHNLLERATPLDLGLPWFSYAAIDFLSGFLRPSMRVFEYGTGGSTLFFARLAARVRSVEDNPQWFELVSNGVKQAGLCNVELKLCPFDFKQAEGFENSEYLRAIGEDRYEVIVIDGSEEWKKVRPICFVEAEKHVGPGGIIVVDDSWRYPRLRTDHHARRAQVFQSVGPCRPGVTSTDVFFY
jgi:predicted O-methyltransferase YrrM